MARSRMIILFDLAKKNHALVCGTENKSENLLGYFTRFGDAASDIEPISHLFKTQVRELAEFLELPQEIINQPPSAGLWGGQTDEKQFGFSYEEADQVLYLYFEKKYSFDKIKSLGFKYVEKIIDLVNANSFKHQVPYVLR
jgi:NAD+ synthase